MLAPCPDLGPLSSTLLTPMRPALLLAQVAFPVNDGDDSFGDQIGDAFSMALAAIPRVLGFLVILILGWFVASALATGVAALLRRVNFNQMAERSGLAGFVRNMGVDTDASGFVASVAKWFVRLIALVVAFDALGLPAVSEVLQQLLLWLPNLVVALVILVLGGLAANALANLVRGATAEADVQSPNLFATLAKAAVWGFAIVIAVNQLGIAQTLVNTLFIGIVGALALALGLAFGLGGRETAARYVERWSRQAEANAPKMREAAQAATRQADEMRQAASVGTYGDPSYPAPSAPPSAPRPSGHIPDAGRVPDAGYPADGRPANPDRLR